MSHTGGPERQRGAESPLFTNLPAVESSLAGLWIRCYLFGISEILLFFFSPADALCDLNSSCRRQFLHRLKTLAYVRCGFFVAFAFHHSSVCTMWPSSSSVPGRTSQNDFQLNFKHWKNNNNNNNIFSVYLLCVMCYLMSPLTVCAHGNHIKTCKLCSCLWLTWIILIFISKRRSTKIYKNMTK